ncbi:MAG: bifunctional DNA primase/polymerase [Candidatus Nitrosocosmicus sp.]|nr:bifunctional DNA primase/polymerase [Candidatus Nitrosocosmicus sp.]
MNNSDILDYFFHNLGINIKPCYYKDKVPIGNWKDLQTNALSCEEYEKLKLNHPNSNWALVTGKIWRGPHKDKYLVIIDLDNKKAIDEFLSHFSDDTTFNTIAQKTIVVQHSDTISERAHIYFVTETPITKRSGIHGHRKDNTKNEEIPSIEVKSDSSTYVICPPSLSKNGHPYMIMGTKDVLILNETATKELDNMIEQIYQKVWFSKPDRVKQWSLLLIYLN